VATSSPEGTGVGLSMSPDISMSAEVDALIGDDDDVSNLATASSNSDMYDFEEERIAAPLPDLDSNRDRNSILFSLGSLLPGLLDGNASGNAGSDRWNPLEVVLQEQGFHAGSTTDAILNKAMENISLQELVGNLVDDDDDGVVASLGKFDGKVNNTAVAGTDKRKSLRVQQGGGGNRGRGQGRGRGRVKGGGGRGTAAATGRSGDGDEADAGGKKGKGGGRWAKRNSSKKSTGGQQQQQQQQETRKQPEQASSSTS